MLEQHASIVHTSPSFTVWLKCLVSVYVESEELEKLSIGKDISFVAHIGLDSYYKLIHGTERAVDMHV